MSSALLVHGVVMIASFGILYPSGAFVARNVRSHHWLHIHQALMELATSDVLISGFSALVDANSILLNPNGPIHAKIGFAVFCIMTIITVMALIGTFTSQSLLNPRVKMSFRKWHPMLGILGMVLGWVACVLGMRDLSAFYPAFWPLQYVFIAWVVSFFVIMNAYDKISDFFAPARGHLKGKSNMWNNRAIDPELQGGRRAIPEFTRKEFNERVKNGATWIICNDDIFDVSTFMQSHPGGRDILQSAIGQDVTEYFYKHSGSTMAQSINLTSTMRLKYHFHSKFARLSLNECIVGTLKPSVLTKVKSNEKILPSYTEARPALQPNSQHINEPVPEITVNEKISYSNDYRLQRLHSTIVDTFKAERNPEGDIQIPVKRHEVSVIDIRLFSDTKDDDVQMLLVTLKFADPETQFVCLPGDSIFLTLTMTEKHISRHYVPITTHPPRGYLHLLIHKYPTGEFTSHLKPSSPIIFPKTYKFTLSGPLRSAKIESGDTTDATYASPILNDLDPSGCFQNVLVMAGGSGASTALLFVSYYLRFWGRVGKFEDEDNLEETEKVTLRVLFCMTSNALIGAEFVRYMEEMQKQSRGILIVNYVVGTAIDGAAELDRAWRKARISRELLEETGWASHCLDQSKYGRRSSVAVICGSDGFNVAAKNAAVGVGFSHREIAVI